MERDENKKDFFKNLRVVFGNKSVQILKDFFRNNLALAKARNKKKILLRGRKFHIYPGNRRLTNKFKIDEKKFQAIQDKFNFAIINCEINETFVKINRLNKNRVELMGQIKRKFPEDVYTDFFNNASTRFDMVYENIKKRQIKIFLNMLWPEVDEKPVLSEPVRQPNAEIEPTQGRIGGGDSEDEKWLVNLTNLEIPVDIKKILKLGNKFCLPFKKDIVPYHKIIADIESGISGLEETAHTNIRNRLVNMLTNFKTNNYLGKQLLSMEEIQQIRGAQNAKKFLNEHPELYVLKADKGNITVLMPKIEYLEKMELLLSDNNTYMEIRKVGISSMQSKLNVIIGSWERLGKIEKNVAKFLKNYHGTTPRMYGLPKVHKIDIPVRPIVSYLGSPLYNLSKFLSNILNNYVGNNFSAVKNAEDFKNKIKNVSLPTNYILVSLDVVSLFTNVDSSLVIILVKKLWNSIKTLSNTNLESKNFVEGLKFVLDHTEFSFGGRCFRQVFGSPMGSPVSPTVANLVMEYVETEVLKASSVKPIFFYRYVDDIIAAIPNSEIDNFLESFNSFTPRIKFTCEIENQGRLAFLDTMVIRNEDGSLTTDLYHKKTWSGRYLNYNSWLPSSYKNNTVFLLAEKILRLSDEVFHAKNFEILSDVLIQNGYPRSVVTGGIRKAIDKHSNSGNILENTRENPNLIVENNRKLFISVPYVKILFEKIKVLLQNYDIQLVGRAFQSLDMVLFTKLKDKIPIELQSNLIYKLKCSCGKEYVGQTKQNLKKRVRQHIYDSTYEFKPSHSALSNHLRGSNHSLSIDDAEILDKEQNLNKRLILESIYIKKHQNSSQNLLNIQEVSKYLLNYYDNIF